MWASTTVRGRGLVLGGSTRARAGERRYQDEAQEGKGQSLIKKTYSEAQPRPRALPRIECSGMGLKPAPISFWRASGGGVPSPRQLCLNYNHVVLLVPSQNRIELQPQLAC
eukprot:scaffold3726_cov107-Isochrysis_galbana.AAC.3